MQLSHLIVIKENCYYPHFIDDKTSFSLSDLPKATQLSGSVRTHIQFWLVLLSFYYTTASYKKKKKKWDSKNIEVFHNYSPILIFLLFWGKANNVYFKFIFLAIFLTSV